MLALVGQLRVRVHGYLHIRSDHQDHRLRLRYARRSLYAQRLEHPRLHHRGRWVSDVHLTRLRINSLRLTLAFVSHNQQTGIPGTHIRIYCVSINLPGDLDLRSFDL